MSEDRGIFGTLLIADPSIISDKAGEIEEVTEEVMENLNDLNIELIDLSNLEPNVSNNLNIDPSKYIAYDDIIIQEENQPKDSLEKIQTRIGRGFSVEPTIEDIPLESIASSSITDRQSFTRLLSSEPTKEFSDPLNQQDFPPLTLKRDQQSSQDSRTEQELSRIENTLQRMRTRLDEPQEYESLKDRQLIEESVSSQSISNIDNLLSDKIDEKQSQDAQHSELSEMSRDTSHLRDSFSESLQQKTDKKVQDLKQSFTSVTDSRLRQDIEQGTKDYRDLTENQIHDSISQANNLIENLLDRLSSTITEEGTELNESIMLNKIFDSRALADSLISNRVETISSQDQDARQTDDTIEAEFIQQEQTDRTAFITVKQRKLYNITTALKEIQEASII